RGTGCRPWPGRSVPARCARRGRRRAGRLEQERGRGRTALIRAAPDVGEPGAVVHRHVQVVVAGALVARGRRGAAEEAVTAPERNAAQLLGIEVQQLPRMLAHVADWDPRAAVAVAQPGDAMPAQDAVDG